MGYQHVTVPSEGKKITVNQDFTLNVPDHPIIPYIEGDGTGIDITPVMKQVVDAAVKKAYGGKREIKWMEIYAGEKATKVYGKDVWLPPESIEIVRDYVVSIKGPLTTPVGGGIRSLNVTLRQDLDLYVCLRPVRYFDGVPSPLREPWHTNMVIFRENSEDIYAGIEWQGDSKEAKEVIHFLQNEMKVKKIRFPEHCGIGVKPVSKEGTARLVKRAIQYAIDHERDSVTLVHKGNIMKFTEGAFRDWGYEVASTQFGAKPLDGGPWQVMKNPKTGKDIIIKDVIADAFLQQILTRPADYSVIATLNLNGDYISDALAAQVGGIGIAPGANKSLDSAIKIKKLKALSNPDILKKALAKWSGIDTKEITVDIKSMSQLINPIIDSVENNKKNTPLLLKNTVKSLEKTLLSGIPDVEKRKAKYNLELNAKVNNIAQIEAKINTQLCKKYALEDQLMNNPIKHTAVNTDIINEITTFKNRRSLNLFFSRKPKNDALDNLIKIIQNNKKTILVEALISKWLDQYDSTLSKNRNKLKDAKEIFCKHEDTATEKFIKKLRQLYGYMQISTMNELSLDRDQNRLGTPGSSP